MQHGPPRRRRARPVSDAPVEALLARDQDLAKGWLLAMVEQSPLEQVPGILSGEFAHAGPRLCAAVVRALAADADLRRLEPGGELEPLVSRTAEIAGVREMQASLGAVDALAAVIWSAVRSELGDPDGDQVSELAERLALVSELVRAAVLQRATDGAEQEQGPGPDPQQQPVPQPQQQAAGPDQAPVAEVEPDPVPDARQSHLRAVAPVAAPLTSEQARATTEPARPTSEPRPPSYQRRAQAADPLWKGALADELARAAGSGTTLSLLLIELEDAERMRAADFGQEANANFSRFSQALRAVVRRQDILAWESDGRAWVIARDTGRLGARALGERAAASVRAAARWRGAPLTISVGVAVYPDDAREVEALLEAAREACVVAAASGVDLATAGGAPGDGGPDAAGSDDASGGSGSELQR